uniref:Uncharacterized protein n=1 Tax=Arundo donax TaxID=35708 RepID=A0A0A9CDS5_ARUDO
MCSGARRAGPLPRPPLRRLHRRCRRLARSILHPCPRPVRRPPPPSAADVTQFCNLVGHDDLHSWYNTQGREDQANGACGKETKKKSHGTEDGEDGARNRGAYGRIGSSRWGSQQGKKLPGGGGPMVVW